MTPTQTSPGCGLEGGVGRANARSGWTSSREVSTPIARIASRDGASRYDRCAASRADQRTSVRTGREPIGAAPTPTSATGVRVSRPDAHSRNRAYGNPHGRSGSVASSTPIPGTITTSCRRTQAAVRNTSTAFPAPFVTTAPARDAVRYSPRFQCIRVAAIPNRADTDSGPPQNASTTASGCAPRRYPRSASSDPSLPRFPEPSRPNTPIRRGVSRAGGIPAASRVRPRFRTARARPLHEPTPPFPRLMSASPHARRPARPPTP